MTDMLSHLANITHYLYPVKSRFVRFFDRSDKGEFVDIYIRFSLINHSIIFAALLSSAGISSLSKKLSS